MAAFDPSVVTHIVIALRAGPWQRMNPRPRRGDGLSATIVILRRPKP